MLSLMMKIATIFVVSTYATNGMRKQYECIGFCPPEREGGNTPGSTPQLEIRVG
jgi:hypothetical protein